MSTHRHANPSPESRRKQIHQMKPARETDAGVAGDENALVEINRNDRVDQDVQVLSTSENSNNRKRAVDDDDTVYEGETKRRRSRKESDPHKRHDRKSKKSKSHHQGKRTAYDKSLAPLMTKIENLEAEAAALRKVAKQMSKRKRREVEEEEEGQEDLGTVESHESQSHKGPRLESSTSSEDISDTRSEMSIHSDSYNMSSNDSGSAYYSDDPVTAIKESLRLSSNMFMGSCTVASPADAAAFAKEIWAEEDDDDGATSTTSDNPTTASAAVGADADNDVLTIKIYAKGTFRPIQDTRDVFSDVDILRKGGAGGIGIAWRDPDQGTSQARGYKLGTGEDGVFSHVQAELTALVEAFDQALRMVDKQLRKQHHDRAFSKFRVLVFTGCQSAVELFDKDATWMYERGHDNIQYAQWTHPLLETVCQLCHVLKRRGQRRRYYAGGGGNPTVMVAGEGDIEIDIQLHHLPKEVEESKSGVLEFGLAQTYAACARVCADEDDSLTGLAHAKASYRAYLLARGMRADDLLLL